MEQIGNCGKTSVFSSKRSPPLMGSPQLHDTLLTTQVSFTRADHLSLLARNAKCKAGWDLSGNQAQIPPTRGNPVLSSLL